MPVNTQEFHKLSSVEQHQWLCGFWKLDKLNQALQSFEDKFPKEAEEIGFKAPLDMPTTRIKYMRLFKNFRFDKTRDATELDSHIQDLRTLFYDIQENLFKDSSLRAKFEPLNATMNDASQIKTMLFQYYGEVESPLDTRNDEARGLSSTVQEIEKEYYARKERATPLTQATSTKTRRSRAMNFSSGLKANADNVHAAIESIIENSENYKLSKEELYAINIYQKLANKEIKPEDLLNRKNIRNLNACLRSDNAALIIASSRSFRRSQNLEIQSLRTDIVKSFEVTNPLFHSILQSQGRRDSLRRPKKKRKVADLVPTQLQEEEVYLQKFKEQIADMGLHVSLSILIAGVPVTYFNKNGDIARAIKMMQESSIDLASFMKMMEKSRAVRLMSLSNEILFTALANEINIRPVINDVISIYPEINKIAYIKKWLRENPTHKPTPAPGQTSTSDLSNYLDKVVARIVSRSKKPIDIQKVEDDLKGMLAQQIDSLKSGCKTAQDLAKFDEMFGGQIDEKKPSHCSSEYVAATVINNYQSHIQTCIEKQLKSNSTISSSPKR